jgi:hypothetical protein
MKLDRDEERLLKSFERGEWKAIEVDHTALREYAREQLRADVQAGFDALARGVGRFHNRATGRRLAQQIKARGRARRPKQS